MEMEKVYTACDLALRSAKHFKAIGLTEVAEIITSVAICTSIVAEDQEDDPVTSEMLSHSRVLIDTMYQDIEDSGIRDVRDRCVRKMEQQEIQIAKAN